MELHLCNSIDELNLQAELPSDKYKLKNPKILIMTANKLFEQAVKLREKGDAELSYVSFMKYLNLVSSIRKTTDYRKDEKFYNNLLGTKNVQGAIENCEKLQKDLQRRYADREEENKLRLKLQQLDIMEDKENQLNKKSVENEEAKSNNSTDVQKQVPIPTPTNIISTWEFDAMIKQKSTSFVIFDVRSKEDFAASHIKHLNCFSIPEDTLKPGLSAAALFKQLPLETRVHWNKRLTVDVIVLVDWFGPGRLPGTAVHALEEIFTKWDPSSKYNGTTKLLTGGYDEWLFRFPMQTTNPQVIRPMQISSSVQSFTPVDDIEYPDFDDEMRKLVQEANPAPTQPTINRTTKPSIEVAKPIERVDPYSPPSAFIASTTFVPTPAPPTMKEQIMPNFKTEDRVPQVDRNLKQKAMITYRKAEEDLVEKYIATTQKRLQQENEWEMLRIKKESSVNSEMTAQLQEKEEQLIDMLRKMEAENKQQELEITRLRKEVDEFQKRNESAGDQMHQGEEETSIEERIKSKEAERVVMYQEVERIRNLRKEAERAAQAEKEAKLRREQEADERRKDEERKRLEFQREEEAKRKKEEEIKVAEENRKRLEQQQIKDSLRKDTVVRTEKLRDEQSASSFGFGSKMNRSHSTPDLAQALQNEEVAAKIPRVERTLKPLTPNRTRIIPRPDLSKNRNFNPVYGSNGRGLTGLKNLGNTCYMNSIIQCISHCTLLTNFFVDGSYRDYLNHENIATRGDITDEVSSTLKALWSGQYRSISCKDLKNAVGRYKSSFRGFEQQDSHEFLTILVDWLHEELNEIRVKAPLKEQNNYNIPDETAANMAWKDYNNSNKSVIVKLFGGQQRSSLQCSACGKESVTFEPFFNLSLPIPQSSNNCNIMDCFQLYTKPEQISGWSCPFCKHKKGASKKIDIWKLPPVLVVHLQRFYNDGLWRKRLTMVDFSVTELNMEGVVKSSSPGYSKFKLYAVSNHYGTMDAGHYTAYCKNPEFNRWFKFDDQDVMEINGNEVRSAAAYILFYTAIDYQAPKAIKD